MTLLGVTLLAGAGTPADGSVAAPPLLGRVRYDRRRRDDGRNGTTLYGASEAHLEAVERELRFRQEYGDSSWDPKQNVRDALLRLTQVVFGWIYLGREPAVRARMLEQAQNIPLAAPGRSAIAGLRPSHALSTKPMPIRPTVRRIALSETCAANAHAVARPTTAPAISTLTFLASQSCR